MKNKGLSTGDLSDKVVKKLKDIASQLGINWRKMLVTSDSLYKTDLKKLETLKIKSHYSQNNSNLSSSEKSRLRELARDIESLNDDIASTSNKIKKIKDSLNKNISNYNDYTRSLASLDNLIKNEWSRTTSTLSQLSQWFQLNTNQENSVQDAKEDPGAISSQISRTDVSDNSVYPEPASSSSSPESGQIQSTPEDSEEENLWGWGSVVGSSTIVAGSYTYATPRIMGPGVQLDHAGSTTEIEVDDVNGTFNVNYDYGSYNYVAWGRWNGGASTVYHESGHDPFDDVDGHWVHGETLGADEIPTSGTATYNGELIGGYVNHGTGTVEPNSITGTMNLTAIFSNGGTGIAGGMNLNRNGVPWAVTHFNSANARAAGDDYFRADMTVVDGGVGDIIGSFYGPNGEEIGGAFMVDKQSGDWGGAAGVFRAKK